MTDFNDMHTELGPEAVLQAIDNAEPVLEEVTDAVERLAALPRLEYERVRTAEAKKLGIRKPVLDSAVYKARPIEEKERATMFSPVEQYHEVVNGAELLDEIADTIREFIICDPETVTAASLWIAFTWFIDRVQVAPIAMITAPEMQCGKTQLLTLIGKLSYQPLMASNISPAAIFRVIEAHSPTLLIDEADSFLREHEEARGIINSGHTKQSAYVIRVVGDDHEPTQFSTWGAKAISGIGKQAATVMDRSITLELRRKLPHEDVKRLRHAATDKFEILTRKLARFSVDAGDAIEASRPVLPESLSDRAQDNWEPLLSIADYVGTHWPETARSAAMKMHHKGQAAESASVRVKLLSDIQEVFENSIMKERISTHELLKGLHEMEDRPWPEWYRGKPITAQQVARQLKPFGITPRKLRFGLGTGRGYEFKQFKDAFERYLDGTTEQTINNNALQPCEGGTSILNVPPPKPYNAL